VMTPCVFDSARTCAPRPGVGPDHPCTGIGDASAWVGVIDIARGEHAYAQARTAGAGLTDTVRHIAGPYQKPKTQDLAGLGFRLWWAIQDSNL
jgi:hypothetical protein